MKSNQGVKVKQAQAPIVKATPEPTPTPLPPLRPVWTSTPNPYEMNKNAKEIHKDGFEGIYTSRFARNGVIEITFDVARLLVKGGPPCHFIELQLDTNGDGKNEPYFSNKPRGTGESRMDTGYSTQVIFPEIQGVYKVEDNETERRKSILSQQEPLIRIVNFDDKGNKYVLQEVVERLELKAKD